MKAVFFGLFILISTSSFASEHTVEVMVHKYNGSLTEIIQSLTMRLREKVKMICINDQDVAILNPVVQFLGDSRSAGELNLFGSSDIYFPSHPVATLKAKVKCLNL